MAQDLKTTYMKIARRAEASDPKVLAQTFVQAGSLWPALSNTEHQILYGRRGTGKTHALVYLLENIGKDVPIYIDMRTIGSSGGIYADPDLPLSERATRLLSDTLSALHGKLFEYVIDNSSEFDLSIIGPKLDEFAEQFTEVRVIGAAEEETTQSNGSSDEESVGAKFSLAEKPGLELTAGIKSGGSHSTAKRTKVTGKHRHHIHFGALQSTLERLQKAFGRRLWIVLDEWSVVPIDLQPYLADLLRRSIFPLRNFTVKIGAIEQRSDFRIEGAHGDYIGIELGADASADVNLDDYLVFDNDASKATRFFQELLFRHYKSVSDTDSSIPPIATGSSLISQSFTQRSAFDELVKAAEGVPRDAIHLISLAAQRAGDDKISIEHVRTSAKSWYNQDKGRAVHANQAAGKLLHVIIHEVIRHRKTRAFFLQNDIKHPLIDSLFDARVLHIRKRNISASENPGVRYDVYKIDYGCYVDLLTSSEAPKGLFEYENPATDKAEFIEVPPDDYRSIRRAVLDPEKLLQAETTSARVLVPVP